jgi:hypothetical protein
MFGASNIEALKFGDGGMLEVCISGSIDSLNFDVRHFGFVDSGTFHFGNLDLPFQPSQPGQACQPSRPTRPAQQPSLLDQPSHSSQPGKPSHPRQPANWSAPSLNSQASYWQTFKMVNLRCSAFVAIIIATVAN